MSRFTLKMIFHGMCTFVPERDGKRMWVFLVGTGQGGGDVPAHAAFIRYSIISADGIPVTRFWRLNGLDVRILPSSGRPLKISCYDAVHDICLNPAQPAGSCFCWVAPGHTACAARGLPDGGKLDRRFLTHLPLPVGDALKLRARFLLTEGDIGAYQLASFGEDLIVSRFRPVGGALFETDHRQFTAASVSLMMTVEGDYVTFKAERLSSGEDAGSLRLASPGDGGVVIVEVLNEEAERLIGISRTDFPQPGLPRLQDRVFESIFNLSVSPPAQEERPIPIAERFVEAPNGYPIVDGSPPCSPNRLLAPLVIEAQGAATNVEGGGVERAQEVPAFEGRRGLVNLSFAQKYLVRFGYLDRKNFKEGLFDPATLDALMRFQEFFGLSLTGGLDFDVSNFMRIPRCGLLDWKGSARLKSCPWRSVSRLAYEFGVETKDLDPGEGFSAVQEAIRVWNDVLLRNQIPIMLVKKTTEEIVHVKIEWRKMDADVDLSGTPVAHADLPPDCGVITNGGLPKPVHFDEEEKWVRGQVPQEFDIFSVALHEIGHILGLAHSKDSSSAMYPLLPPFYILEKPTLDDERDLVKLYKP